MASLIKPFVITFLKMSQCLKKTIHSSVYFYSFHLVKYRSVLTSEANESEQSLIQGFPKQFKLRWFLCVIRKWGTLMINLLILKLKKILLLFLKEIAQSLIFLLFCFFCLDEASWIFSKSASFHKRTRVSRVSRVYAWKTELVKCDPQITLLSKINCE